MISKQYQRMDLEGNTQVVYKSKSTASEEYLLQTQLSTTETIQNYAFKPLFVAFKQRGPSRPLTAFKQRKIVKESPLVKAIKLSFK